VPEQGDKLCGRAAHSSEAGHDILALGRCGLITGELRQEVCPRLFPDFIHLLQKVVHRVLGAVAAEDFPFAVKNYKSSRAIDVEGLSKL
jgi:hypothetical protein